MDQSNIFVLMKQVVIFIMYNIMSQKLYTPLYIWIENQYFLKRLL